MFDPSRKFLVLFVIALFSFSCSKAPDGEEEVDLAEESISAEEEAREEEEAQRREAAAKKREAAKARVAKMRADADKKARADAARAEKERAKAKIASRKANAKSARESIVGKTLSSIVTKGGTYTKAKVTAADGTKLTIFHENGATSIPYPELPADLKKQLHFHKDDYAEALAATKNDTVAAEETKDVSAKTSGSKSGKGGAEEFAKEAKLVAHYKDLYRIKQGEASAVRKQMKQTRAKMGDLQKALRSNLRKRTDETALLKLQTDYGKLLAKEAMAQAEADDAMMRMALSPSQYHDVEPMLAQYKKLLVEWHKLKGNIKIGRDKAYRMERIANDAVVKSGRKEAEVKKLNAQVEALEVKERLKNGEVNAYRDKLREAKFVTAEKRREEARRARRR